MGELLASDDADVRFLAQRIENLGILELGRLGR